jgi:initiation factor 1A
LFNRPFEVLGITEKLLEDDKILVQGLDRFTKLDRIRDKMKQRVGIISNNGVITKLLNFQAVKQGDKTNRFRRNQIDWLKSNDYLKTVLPVKGEL